VRDSSSPSGGYPGKWPSQSFLGRLNQRDRDDLISLGGHTTYRPGEHLFIEGDPGEFLVLIYSGHVKVVAEDDRGQYCALAIRGPGSLLGELSYLDGQTRSASVVATNLTRAGKITRQKFDQYLSDNPQVGREVSRLIAQRLRASDGSLLAFQRDEVAVRVAKLLLALSEDPDNPTTSAGAVIELSQEDIAQLVHAAAVTVNRVLRDFRDQVLVRTAYRRIEIPCRWCLDRLATTPSAGPNDRMKLNLGCGGRQSHQSR
jgi:CRP/FNR family transcriptional regulator, cyclic AMP receptor protein